MILVTGGNGFLGSALVERLAASGAPVRATARRPEDLPPRLRLPSVEWVKADVLDVVALEEAMQGVDTVYHCAAKVSFESRDHKTMMAVNITGTANVVNASIAAGVRKLLHVSSTAALGRSAGDALIDENAEWRANANNSVYAQSKYLAEREVWRGTQEGLAAVIVNPSVIIGPGDWLHGTPRLFHASRRGMPVYPRGTNAFVALDDVVTCMVTLMDGPIQNERFVVTAGNMLYKDFFTIVTRELGVRQPSIAIPQWAIGLGWRVSLLLQKTFGIYPLLTRETARTVNGQHRYSNEKIVQRLGVSFVEPTQFVSETARLYKATALAR